MQEATTQQATASGAIPAGAWLTLVASLLVTFIAAYTVHQSITRTAQVRFEELSANVRLAVTTRMQAYEQVLRGGIGLFEASDEVNRDDWKQYVAALNIEENFPGIQGIGFAQYIPASRLNQHIAQMRAQGFPDYTVKPAGKRAEYTAIIYLEPFNARNQRAFGYDMFSEPTRRAAMELARDSGKSIVSGKVTLVQETSKDVQAGFLMYLPLYQKHVVLHSPAERRQALLGYVYAPFRARDLMQGILSGDTRDLHLEIYDGHTPSAQNLLFDSDNSRQKPHAVTSMFSKTIHVQIEGRDWSVTTHSTPVFEARIDYTKVWVIAGAGLLLSLMISLTVWSIATGRARAQKLAEKMSHTAREREAMLNAIFSNAADAIITINEDGLIQSFNQAASRIFGYSEDEALGRNVSMLMPDPYHLEHDRYLAHYLRTGEGKMIGGGAELTGLHKNGNTFPIELAISEVRSDDKRVFAGIVRDISERKAAEAALKQSEERFELAIEGANDGLWDWDLQNDSIYLSPRQLEMLGYANQPGSSNRPVSDWLTRIHPKDRQRVEADIQEHLIGKTPHFLCEYRIIPTSGERIWVQTRGLARRDPAGKPYRMTGIQTDITERKRVEKLKSEFVATVSHELRTPLTSILGSLQLVAGGVAGPLSEQGKNLLDIAIKNGQRLQLLINDILDMEKLQTGTLHFNLQIQPVLPLVEQALADNQGYAQHYGVSFILSPAARDCLIRVDGSRFTQILANLLSNAAKFTHSGDKIEVAIEPHDGEISIRVTDHGSGIPEDFKPRIFEKFTQADSSDSRSKGGTGLGLSITKAMVEEMGGRINFDSTVGNGTSFYITFPIVSAH